MWHVPTLFTLQLREFFTAALLAMLVLSDVFFGFYLARAWREIGGACHFRLRCRLFYSDANRAAIGWFTASMGATVKNWAALTVLQAQIEHRHEVSALVPICYTLGTLVALWGMVCLMHALTRGSWYRGQWTVMIGSALAFGAIFAFWL